ncbi:MAG: hypothetical protein N5P05_004469 (plasmid) [Chroococcopsis gigantea SAG 12.99]|jgi:hypothetical protein|nr:DUF4258 domain-containing protein [Chlorogloea purpurea SAG 13.99]MDV3002814.1 hypothetical protein [Chroococcopsis gigantea SAG 12.99]
MKKKVVINRLVEQDPEIQKSLKLSPVLFIGGESHIQRRQQQRAINDDMIKIALTYGRKEYSYGATRFTLTDRILRFTPYAKMTDALRGLRVVCKQVGDSLEIVTAYWATKVKNRSVSV